MTASVFWWAIALTVSNILSTYAGYLWRVRFHRCPEPPPLLRIGAGGRAHLRVSGKVEVGQRFVDVGPTGALFIEIEGDQAGFGPGEHDLTNTTIAGSHLSKA